MYYNLTNATTAVSPYIQLVTLNNITGGLIGILMLFSIYLTVLITFKNQGTKVSFAVAGFSSMFLGVLFWGSNLITFNTLIWPFIMFLVSLLISVFSD